MKKFFIGILTLFLSTAVSSGFLCQGFSSEEECHQDAYQDILKALQQEVQDKNSSISPEEFQGKLAQYLPYNDFVSIFQKCEIREENRKKALVCTYNDVKKFITKPVDNPEAEKFLQDTLPSIVHEWNLENLEKYAINSKLSDAFKVLTQNIKPFAHSCKISTLNAVGQKIDVDTGSKLYEYKADLTCTPKNAKFQTLLISTPDGFKFFNIDCTALLGDLGKLEDYESFEDLFDILRKESLTGENTAKK